MDRGRFAGVRILSIEVADGHEKPIDLNLSKLEDAIVSYYERKNEPDAMSLAKGHRELEMEYL
jgi:hypothetical protein